MSLLHLREPPVELPAWGVAASGGPWPGAPRQAAAVQHIEDEDELDALWAKREQEAAVEDERVAEAFARIARGIMSEDANEVQSESKGKVDKEEEEKDEEEE